MKTEAKGAPEEILTDPDPYLSRARNVMRRNFSSLLAQGVKAFSYYTGWYPLWQQPDKTGPIILFYHKVQRRPAGTWGEQVLDLEAFKQHMAFLAREYQPIHLSELVAALQGKMPMPERAVAITFDDGYRNNLQVAAPILRHYRVPATLFISTGLIGTNQWMWAYALEKIFYRYSLEEICASARHPLITRLCAQAMNRQMAQMACVEYLKSVPHAQLLEVVGRIFEKLPVELDEENQFLSWDEVRQLRSHGFEFGAHTETHPILIRQRLEDVERELVACNDTLERELGTRPKLFAYPNGNTNPAVTALVGRYYEAAVTTRPGMCSPSANLLELPRIGAPRAVSDLAFQMERHLRQGAHSLQMQAY